jgi:hypothetical protein
MSVKLFLAASAAAFCLCAGIGGALAESATAVKAVNIRTSPGGAKVGFLYPGEQVEVTKCGGGWCAITHPGPDGWVSQEFLTFDAEDDFDDEEEFEDEDDVEEGDDFEEEEEETAEVCFYDKANFSGESFCVEDAGKTRKLTGNWNDRISSIEISGDLTVDLCSEKNLYGACGTFSSSKSSLPGGLNNKASSYEIY